MDPLVEKITRKVEFELASISDDKRIAAILRKVSEQLEAMADDWEDYEGWEA